jgi:ATP-dependent DNA helicase RecG
MPNEPVQNVFDNLSDRAQALLRGTEGIDIDWKGNDEVKTEDLVAFSNSPRGGVLMMGVSDKSKGKSKLQEPEIVGCRVDDDARMKVINRGNECSPSIRPQVFVENAKAKPFLRIEVPSGPNRPYCTMGGVYKTRADGRNSAILPTELLTLFVEREGRQFIERFQKATADMQQAFASANDELRSKLAALDKTIAREMEAAQYDANEAREMLGSKIDEIGGQLDQQVSDLHDSLEQSIVHETRQVNLDEVELECQTIKAGLTAVLLHLGLEEPYVYYWRKRIGAIIDRLKRKNPEMTAGQIYNEVEKQVLLREELIVKFCKEKLGNFRVPKKKAKRK